MRGQLSGTSPAGLGVKPTLPSGIVGGFDVVEVVGEGFIEGEVLAPTDPLALKHAEAAFGRGVVAAVPHPAHAQGDVVLDHQSVTATTSAK